MITPERFAVFRRESDGYSSRGPMAGALSFDEALTEARELARKFPHQNFAVMAEVADISAAIHVKAAVKVPALPGKRQRKSAKVIALPRPQRAAQ